MQLHFKIEDKTKQQKKTKALSGIDFHNVNESEIKCFKRLSMSYCDSAIRNNANQ